MNLTLMVLVMQIDSGQFCIMHFGQICGSLVTAPAPPAARSESPAIVKELQVMHRLPFSFICHPDTVNYSRGHIVRDWSLCLEWIAARGGGHYGTTSLLTGYPKRVTRYIEYVIVSANSHAVHEEASK